MDQHRTILFDVETDGLDYTKIHCIAVKDTSHTMPYLLTDEESFTEWAETYDPETTTWVAHNGCGFDWWVIEELTGVIILKENLVDTSVLSKLKDYKKYHTHSLAEIGLSLGVYKGDYDGGWEEYTTSMGEYCLQDVLVLEAIYNSVKDTLVKYPDASRVEHEMAFICTEMQRNGFKFNVEKAEDLLVDVRLEQAELQAEMSREWPPELVVDRTIKWREKPDGTPYLTVIKAQAAAPKWERKGDELVLYKYKEFNPGSPIDRIDKLWDAGWKPYEKTKGHLQHLRDKKGKGYVRK